MEGGEGAEVGNAVEGGTQRQAGYELCPSASDMNAEDINVPSAP